jgi:hypothetical protein
MKFIIATILLLTSTAFAKNNCTFELKFGTKVKIINSSYSEWVDLTFVKGLKGNIVDRYISTYGTNCKGNVVVGVSICVTAHQNCQTFNVCETDVDVID